MGKRTILLVEDDSDDEMLTVRAIRKGRVPGEVIVVRDGAEALEYLFCTGRHSARPPEDRPRLMLLDLKLPKVDGLEVLRRVRADERTRALPVVILTSSREGSDLATGYDLGANSFVVKPVDPVRFDASIAQIGQYWTGLNES